MPIPINAKPSRWPVYIVIDCSYSMNEVRTQVESGLKNIIIELQKRTQVQEVAALSIITYNATPQTKLPLTRISQITDADVPRLEMDGGTMTGSALAHATHEAEKEVVLTWHDVQTPDYRPLLVLMTDGQSNDKNDLMDGIATMRSYKWGDWLIIGYGDADEEELEAIGGKDHWIKVESVAYLDWKLFSQLIVRCFNVPRTMSAIAEFVSGSVGENNLNVGLNDVSASLDY